MYREHSLRLVEKMAERYGSHPALSMWHVSNELGCHNGRCYSELSAQGFRRWLRERYTDLEILNRAWATDFWSQRYGSWEEIKPPRIAPSFSVPHSSSTSPGSRRTPCASSCAPRPRCYGVIPRTSLSRLSARDYLRSLESGVSSAVGLRL